MLLLCAYGTLAQNKSLDSLQQILRSSKADTSRINVLNKIANRLYKDYAPAKEVLKFSERALKLSEALNFKKGIARSSDITGRAYDDAYESEKALVHLLRAIKVYEELGGLERSLADVNIVAAVIYINQGRYQTSYSYLNDALKIYDEIDDKVGSGYALSNLGLIFRHQGNYNKSIEYYIRSLTMREASKDLVGMANIYGNLGNLYYSQGNRAIALDYQLKAKALAEKLNNKPMLANIYNNIGILFQEDQKYDEAIEQHEKALAIFEELGSKMSMASSLSNIGALYNDQGKFEESLESTQLALEIFQEIGNNATAAINFLEIGSILTKLNRFSEAYENITQGNKLALLVGNKDVELKGYDALYRYYEAIKDYKLSFENFKKYAALKDSLFNIEKSEQIGEIQTKYETDKKESENELLRQEQIAKNAVIDSKSFQNNLLIACVLFFVLFSGYYYINSRQKQKINKLLNAQNEEINQKQEEIITINASLQKSQDQVYKANEKLQLLNAGLEDVVKQRTSALQRINEELDTFLYQSSHALRRPIVSVMGLIQIARLESNQLNVSNIYDKIDKTASRMDLMLRKLVMASEINFAQEMLEPVDFEIILAELWSSLRASNDTGKMKFKLKVDKGIHYNADRKLVSIMLENIIENAITFHLETPQRKPLLEVQVKAENETIQILIHDNGRGIPEESLPKVFDMFTVANDAAKGFGLGLYISKKAIEKLGGTIKIASKRGEFTSIGISLPA